MISINKTVFQGAHSFHKCVRRDFALALMLVYFGYKLRVAKLITLHISHCQDPEIVFSLTIRKMFEIMRWIDMLILCMVSCFGNNEFKLQ